MSDPASRARRVLAALFISNLLIYLARYLLAGVLPLVARALPATSKAMLGALASAFVACYLLSAPVFGALGDRMARRLLLASGAALSALSSASVALVDGLSQLFATRIGLGIGQSAFVTVAPTLLADCYPPERRAAAIGTLSAAQPLGTALSYLLTGVLVGFGFGWRTPFWIVALPSLLAAAWLLRLPELPRGAAERVDGEALDSYLAARSGWRRYLDLARTPSYLLDTLAMSANSFAMGGLAFWMPTFLHKTRGLSVAVADITFGGVTAVVGVLGAIGGGLAADRLSRRTRRAPALVAGVAALCAVPLFYAFFAAERPFVFWSVMALGELLLFVGPGPANTILLNVIEPRARAMGNALNIVTIHLLGELSSPLIIGLFADQANMTRGIEVAAWAIGVSGLLWLATAPFVPRDMARVEQKIAEGQNP